MEGDSNISVIFGDNLFAVYRLYQPIHFISAINILSALYPESCIIYEGWFWCSRILQGYQLQDQSIKLSDKAYNTTYFKAP